MKKHVSLLLLALLLCLSSFSLAEGAEWTFPVPLYEMQSEYLILVNTDHVLSKEDVPSPLVKVTGVKKATSADVQMQETAANALKEMFEAATLITEYTYLDSNGKEQTQTYSNGMRLYLKSGYRSYSTQKTIYANHLESNGGKDDGYVQKPGASEHQTGLCADILNSDFAQRPKMTQDFQYTPEAQWMKENCAYFGFILRYTTDEASTGISFEPWHFRYVGLTAALYIMQEGITLEQFTQQYEAALAAFTAAGGNVEEQIEYELKYANKLPDSYVLEDVLGEDGDTEVTLDF